jgi:predicted TIM-barrel fold metal-dependent hydrolase
MKTLKKQYSTAALLFIAILQSCTSPGPAATVKEVDADSFYSAEDFKTIEKIDAHVHVNTKDSLFMMQAKEDNFKLFTINWDDVNDPPPMEVQQEYSVFLINKYPEQIGYATTISIRNFNSNNWLAQTLAYIDSSVKKGAKAVKIYKVIGMTLRDRHAKLVMVDDPRFDSLFNYLAQHDIPVVGHLGEPRNCWLPLDKMTVKGDMMYFKEHPEYHMFLHRELPSYEDQIRARDNMVAKHPDLKFVGAHLGSLEWNVDSLAARLDRFPNMAVDMAARIVHFEVQAKDNWQKVHDFLMKYNDRLLYATDLLVDSSYNMKEAAESAHKTWMHDWKFFTSDEKMTSDEFDGSFNGMKLPKKVIDNIYYRNAQQWLKVF